MVVVGGYVGKDLSCDSPGIYVFNTSSLTWQNTYQALAGGNALGQQKAQNQDLAGLGGSYGYQVPAAVQSVIGGNAQGSATITAPAQAATDGPLATGRARTYTVTGTDGAVVTQTSTAPPGVQTGSGSNNGGKGNAVGAIVAGTIAGILALLASYLGFCAFVYRRQLKMYKQHVAVSQRANLGLAPGFIPYGGSGRDSDSLKQNLSSEGTSSQSNRLGSNKPGYQPIHTDASSSTEDLFAGHEPTFVGVMLNPRRSLRVINKD